MSVLTAPDTEVAVVGNATIVGGYGIPPASFLIRLTRWDVDACIRNRGFYKPDLNELETN